MGKLGPIVSMVLLIGVGSCGDGDGGGGSADSDAGRDGGFTLLDGSVAAESIILEPAEIAFEDVAIGDSDIHTITVRNGSTSPLRMSDVRIEQSDDTVTFANLFIGDMTETHGWLDTNADRQNFETRDDAITVIPGGTFDILVQYRPDGGLLDCLDRAPAPCGFVRVSGQDTDATADLFVPRAE